MDDTGEKLLQKHHEAHCAYWAKVGGEGYDVNRFDEGFRAGYEDGAAGVTDDSKRPERKAAHIASWGESPALWEWDHGYSEGQTAKLTNEEP